MGYTLKMNIAFEKTMDYMDRILWDMYAREWERKREIESRLSLHLGILVILLTGEWVILNKNIPFMLDIQHIITYSLSVIFAILWSLSAYHLLLAALPIDYEGVPSADKIMDFSRQICDYSEKIKNRPQDETALREIQESIMKRLTNAASTNRLTNNKRWGHICTAVKISGPCIATLFLTGLICISSFAFSSSEEKCKHHHKTGNIEQDTLIEKEKSPMSADNQNANNRTPEQTLESTPDEEVPPEKPILAPNELLKEANED